MISFEPLTPANWIALVELFADKGACGGCWCMYWRYKAADYNRQKGIENKNAFKQIIERSSPGILGFVGDTAAAWCAIAPREAYVRLENSKILKPVDGKDVWSVTCFFIKKQFRRNHFSLPLLKAAVDFAFRNGAGIVEGYPIDTTRATIADAFAWTGIMSTYENAGFKEVERRSRTRPIMRLVNNIKF
jgi:hypothetical protein